MLKLDLLLPLLPDIAAVHGPTTHIEITAVTEDSRAVEPGALFVAVVGAMADGHQYIEAACRHGAVAVAGMRTPEELAQAGLSLDRILPANVPYLQVKNSRLTLAYAAAALYGFPSRDLAVIGVTGTDGKTTTCTLLESILHAATRPGPGMAGDVGVVTTVGARIRGEESETGFHVTTPGAPEVQRYLAEMRDAACRYAVVESTSQGLDQERVGAVAFDVAAVTNITHEHLDYHGTRDAYVQAKAKLLRSLYATPSKSGIARGAVLNGDDAGSYAALCRSMDESAAATGRSVRRLVYGVRATAAAADTALDAGELDVAAYDVAHTPRATRLRLRRRTGDLAISTPLIGEFNIYNVLCAATAAFLLNVDPVAIQTGIAELDGVSGRMERIEMGQSFLAIVDFAHSPVSLERALQTLRPLVGTRPDGAPGQLIAVFGSAGLRDLAKRELMGKVSGQLADYTVITAEDPRTEDLNAINQAIEAGVVAANPHAAYTIVPDRSEAIQTAVDRALPGDVVAAFGKGHERSMCFGTTETPWSDQDAMRTALQNRLRTKA